MVHEKSVFISYSRRDSRWLNELKRYLAPWISNRLFVFWDDRQIVAGDRWDREIRQAIDAASVAVLLVSQDFLASNYIAQVELPLILDKVAKNETRIIWVPLTPSTVDATPLHQFQAALDPSSPLAFQTKREQAESLVKLAKSIADSFTMRGLAKSFEVIDKTTEEFEAAIQGRPPRPPSPFRVQAKYDATANEIAFSQTQTSILYSDLDRLTPSDREYIADLEETLVANYDRWKSVRQGLGNAGGALDHEIHRELSRIAKLICADLGQILDFVRQMLKAELEDHYGRYRHICSQLGAA